MVNRQTSQITLVDYGFAKPYLNEDGTHIQEGEGTDTFEGNLLFSSLGLLEFKQPSRRDDLISLGYMLVYLLNGQSIPFLKENFPNFSAQTDEDKLVSLSKLKSKISLRKMARKVDIKELLKKQLDDWSPTTLEDTAAKVKLHLSAFFK